MLGFREWEGRFLADCNRRVVIEKDPFLLHWLEEEFLSFPLLPEIEPGLYPGKDRFSL